MPAHARLLVPLLASCLCLTCHAQPTPSEAAYRTLPVSFTALLPAHLDNQQLVISSVQQRDALLERLAPEHGADAAAWRRAVLDAFAASHVDLREEAVVLVQRVFGTGMANASLSLSGPESGSVTATLSVHWPKGPATPDIGSTRFAFAVKTSSVSRVQIVLAGTAPVTLTIAP